MTRDQAVTRAKWALAAILGPIVDWLIGPPPEAPRDTDLWGRD